MGAEIRTTLQSLSKTCCVRGKLASASVDVRTVQEQHLYHRELDLLLCYTRVVALEAVRNEICIPKIAIQIAGVESRVVVCIGFVFPF